MSKLNIIYWSGTGNTEKMAKAILESVSESDIQAEMKSVSDATSEDLDAEFIALGCPSMGAEELESEMETFIEENKDKFSNKTIGLFGSFDWGDGEWMRTWKETMESYGASIVEEGIIVNLIPSDEDIEEIKKYGKKIVG